MTTRTPVEALLPVKEVAALWRCSPQHIYDLIADGELAFVPLGPRDLRVPESSLADYIRRHGDRAPRRSPRQRDRRAAA